MFSRFTKLFKKNDLDEQRAFQAKVMQILSEMHPDKRFVANEDPLTIDWENGTLGLTNLKSHFLFGPQTDADLKALAEEHFRKAFAAREFLDKDIVTFEKVRSKIMPQLMSESFLQQMELVSFPFGDNVVLGFVIDTEETYSYIIPKQLDDWNVSKEEIKEIAIENLEERSRGIDMMAIPGDNPMFIIQTMDSFDAARIVHTKLRSFIAENVGSPFYFGIPNRDFLICWSKKCDQPFHDQMRSQISKDFDEQPYPLSGSVFEVTKDNEIKIADNIKIDPRAANAGNN